MLLPTKSQIYEHRGCGQLVAQTASDFMRNRCHNLCHKPISRMACFANRNKDSDYGVACVGSTWHEVAPRECSHTVPCPALTARHPPQVPVQGGFPNRSHLSSRFRLAARPKPPVAMRQVSGRCRTSKTDAKTCW
jgi:hypothetical protein